MLQADQPTPLCLLHFAVRSKQPQLDRHLQPPLRLPQRLLPPQLPGLMTVTVGVGGMPHHQQQHLHLVRREAETGGAVHHAVMALHLPGKMVTGGAVPDGTLLEAQEGPLCLLLVVAAAASSHPLCGVLARGRHLQLLLIGLQLSHGPLLLLQLLLPPPPHGQLAPMCHLAGGRASAGLLLLWTTLFGQWVHACGSVG